MSAQRFSPGKRFRWLRDGMSDAEVFEITGVPGQAGQGILELENLLTGGQLKTSLSELIKALFDGCLQFEVHGKVAKLHSQPHLRESAIITQPQHADLSDVPSHLLIIAQRRLEILTPLLQLSPTARTRLCISEHVERAKQLNRQRDRQQGDGSGLNDAVSITSIYRWMHDYTRAGNDLRALIPNTAQRGGKNQTRISSEVEALLDIVIKVALRGAKDVLLHREIATHTDVRDELAARIHTTNQTLSRSEHLRMPSLATIQRRVASLDLQTRLKAKWPF